MRLKYFLVFLASLVIFVTFQNFEYQSTPVTPEVTFVSSNPSYRNLTIRGRRFAIPDKDKGIAGANNDVDEFLGIPYARKPIGMRRWTDTGVLPVLEMNRSTESTFIAQKLSPACPQEPLRTMANLRSEIDILDNMSEDCLYLNLWRPSHLASGQKKRPVMVWIHGGGFVRGAIRNHKFFGELIASHDVVLVTVDYRLGVLGFFGFPGMNEDQLSRGGLTGNYGLIDIINSLKWVQENISAFGGDPNNVTIFVTSAGGATVNTLMTSSYIRRLTAPLFHKAVSQSGGGDGGKMPLLHVAGSNRTSAQSIGGQLWRDLQRSSESTNADTKVVCAPHVDSKLSYVNGLSLNQARSAIRQREGYTISDINLFRLCVSYQDILKRTGLDRVGGEIRSYPYVDGQILSGTTTLELFASGNTLSIPYMNGSAANEASLLFLQGKDLNKTHCALLAKAPKVLMDRTPAISVEQKVAAIAELYGVEVGDITSFMEGGPGSPYESLMNRFFGDMQFSMPAQLLSYYQNRNLSQIASPHSAYSYEYGYLPVATRMGLIQRTNGRIFEDPLFFLKMNGAGHSNEAFALFGKFEDYLQNADAVERQDDEVSKYTIMRWVAFAQSGSPNSQSLEDTNLWPPNLNKTTVFRIKSGYSRELEKPTVQLKTYEKFKNRVMSHLDRKRVV